MTIIPNSHHFGKSVQQCRYAGKPIPSEIKSKKWHNLPVFSTWRRRRWNPIWSVGVVWSRSGVPCSWPHPSSSLVVNVTIWLAGSATISGFSCLHHRWSLLIGIKQISLHPFLASCSARKCSYKKLIKLSRHVQWLQKSQVRAPLCFWARPLKGEPSLWIQRPLHALAACHVRSAEKQLYSRLKVNLNGDHTWDCRAWNSVIIPAPIVVE